MYSIGQIAIAFFFYCLAHDVLVILFTTNENENVKVKVKRVKIWDRLATYYNSLPRVEKIGMLMCLFIIPVLSVMCVIISLSN